MGTNRFSPFDVEVTVWDANNQTIQHRPDVRGIVDRAVQDIYFWNSTLWQLQLRDRGFNRTDIIDIVTSKSNFFWEELAEQIVERVFSVNRTRKVYLFGPTCFANPQTFTCHGGVLGVNGPHGVANAARVAIKTSVHGERDDLMPVSRTIYLFARRPFDVNMVLYTVSVPGVMHVASPFREVLDCRPSVGGHPMNATVTLLTSSPAGREMYPDYNLLFIPLRHLVFQGQSVTHYNIAPPLSKC